MDKFSNIRKESVISNNNSIPFWRIVFAILIVMLHCGYVSGAYIVVEFFFLVSGFLLAKTINERNITIKEFVCKRVKRLYPMYILSLILFILLLEAANCTKGSFSIDNYLVCVVKSIIEQWKSFFMLQLFGHSSIVINSPAWYVPALFWVSSLYFIMSKIMPKRVFLVFTSATSLCLLLLICLFVGNMDLWENKVLFVSEGLIRAYVDVGIGILLYNIKKWLKQRNILVNSMYIIITEAVAFLIIIISVIFLNHTRFDFLLLLVLSILVLVSFSKHDNRFLTSEKINKISKYSYGLYLNHSIFLVLLIFYGIPFEFELQGIKLIWVLCVAMICAFLNQYLVEKIMIKINRLKREKLVLGAIAIVLSIIWLYSLRSIKGSFVTYVIIAFVSVVMSLLQRGKVDKKSVNITICFISVLLSFLIVLGNYYIFTGENDIEKIMRASVTLVSGVFVFYNIFKYGYLNLRGYSFKETRKCEGFGVKIFIIACTVFIIFNVLILVLCKYPCDYMYDSLWQLSEIQANEYTNHHAVYHTFILSIFYNLGYKTGIGLGTGMFFYILLQIVVVGLITGYFIKTLYDMRVPILLMVLAYAYVLLNPISLKYIAYIDKDELFVYMGLLFCTALTRIVYEIKGKRSIDWVLMFIGAFGFGLFRGNGMLVIIVTMAVTIMMKTNVRKKLLIAFSTITVILILLNGPVRSLMGVKPTEFSEGLSIPIQQISRVVYDDCELTNDEKDQIEELVEEEVIKREYNPGNADFTKGKIQFWGRDDYFKENKEKYLKLYIEIGKKYPYEYLKAWIDQTYGYWVPGYGQSYNVFEKYTPIIGKWEDIVEDIEKNRKVFVPQIITILNAYAKMVEENGFLYQFMEIGGIVYLLIYLAFIKVWKKNKTIFIETMGITTVATLLVASPLCAEIRYAYVILLLVYLSVATTFFKNKTEGIESSIQS